MNANDDDEHNGLHHLNMSPRIERLERDVQVVIESSLPLSHSSDGISRTFNCSVCDKGFKEKFGLKRHMRSHTGERPHLCKTCGKRFSETGNLQRHLRLHSGVRPFVCESCNKSFAQRSNLQKHYVACLRRRLRFKLQDATGGLLNMTDRMSSGGEPLVTSVDVSYSLNKPQQQVLTSSSSAAPGICNAA